MSSTQPQPSSNTPRKLSEFNLLEKHLVLARLRLSESSRREHAQLMQRAIASQSVKYDRYRAWIRGMCDSDGLSSYYATRTRSPTDLNLEYQDFTRDLKAQTEQNVMNHFYLSNAPSQMSSTNIQKYFAMRLKLFSLLLETSYALHLYRMPTGVSSISKVLT